MNKVKIMINVPKPLADFYEKLNALIGNSEDTMTTALVNDVDRRLNEMDNAERQNIIKNCGLAELLNAET